MHRIAPVVVGAALALAAPASAQQEGRAAECANEVLEALVGLNPNPSVPVFHVGYAVWFLGCSPYVPPAAVPILDALQDDINTLYRFREELPDLNQYLRRMTCGAWWSIYRNEYEWARYEYGDIVVADLPTPEARSADCDRWVDGNPATGQ